MGGRGGGGGANPGKKKTPSHNPRAMEEPPARNGKGRTRPKKKPSFFWGGGRGAWLNALTAGCWPPRRGASLLFGVRGVGKSTWTTYASSKTRCPSRSCRHSRPACVSVSLRRAAPHQRLARAGGSGLQEGPPTAVLKSRRAVVVVVRFPVWDRNYGCLKSTGWSW